MGPLAALERFFERLFERPSARLFGARLQPVQLLRRVERAMETGRLTTSDAILLPEHVVVRIHPADLAAFGGAADGLAADLADGAMRFARAHGYRLRARPRVDLVADPAAERGDPLAEARFGGHPAERPSVEPIAHEASLAGPPTPVPTPPAAPGSAGSTSVEDDRTMAFPAPVPAPAVARLRILEPHGGDRTVIVRSGSLSIGRGQGNDLVIGDPRVSRRHARIQGRQGRLVLSDLGSRNGTRVNGTPVDEVAIGVGDEILVGDTRLIVDAPGG